jgi:hypothetical protein
MLALSILAILAAGRGNVNVCAHLHLEDTTLFCAAAVQFSWMATHTLVCACASTLQRDCLLASCYSSSSPALKAIFYVYTENPSWPTVLSTVWRNNTHTTVSLADSPMANVRGRAKHNIIDCAKKSQREHIQCPVFRPAGTINVGAAVQGTHVLAVN